MHGRGSRRNSGQSFGSDGRAVNVWRTSPERLRGGTRTAVIGCWQSMEALLPRKLEEREEISRGIAVARSIRQIVSHHWTAGIAGRTRRCGGRVAARGARAAGGEAVHHRLL